ncbi:hypothetical protein PoB_007061900 [Plakobranchus ocellatus]|uniref:Uncharacterized protein n=1 Tax=Plakobranchus ocellatus TaxID=259542 RepID=A0AAV4DJA6_9GAST|nr:hypothetical protein PoB_007061900 [Plakobranchus ocellatus]
MSARLIEVETIVTMAGDVITWLSINSHNGQISLHSPGTLFALAPLLQLVSLDVLFHHLAGSRYLQPCRGPDPGDTHQSRHIHTMVA